MNGYQCPNISTCSCGHAQKGLICSKFPLIFQKYLPCRSLADRYNGIAEGKNDHFRTQFLYMFLNLKSAILLVNKDNTLGCQAFMDMWLMPALFFMCIFTTDEMHITQKQKAYSATGIAQVEILARDVTGASAKVQVLLNMVNGSQHDRPQRCFQHLYFYLPAGGSAVCILHLS